MAKEKNREHDVREAQTEPVAASGEESGETKERKISNEMIIILIIGFLFGVAMKTEISKRINVADSTFYGKQGYSFEEMQRRLDEQSQAQNQAPDQVQP